MFARLSVAFTCCIAATGLYLVVPWTETPSAQTATQDRSLTVKPSDPAALPNVLETLLRLADYSRASDKILSGQNIGHATSDLMRSHYRTWTRLTQFRELSSPAVMAIDLGLNEIPGNASPIVKLANPHVQAGGLVSISMHPSNPWTEGPYDDRRHGRFEELLQSGHAAHRRWQRTLDQVAYVLKELQRNNITVLWRPLHEPNGDWFWWCGGGNDAALTAAQYQQLWRQMQQYLQERHGLHNLIWVYSANARTDDHVLPPLDFYPGNDAVDVVGLDFYGPNIDQLNRLGGYDEIVETGKIVALTEFGSTPMDGSLDTQQWCTVMQRRYPNLAYFVFWHSWPQHWVALADLDDVDTLMTDEWVHHLK